MGDIEVPPAKKLKTESNYSAFDSDVDQVSKNVSNLPGELDSSLLQFSSSTVSISDELLSLELRMCDELSQISFSSPVTHIYNPLSYAKETHNCYVHHYGNSHKKVLFLGMNPGPFGMAQNGVAFGDTTMVKDWLKVTGSVGKPPKEHSKREILGLHCTKNEVSGTRFWGLFNELCGSPDVFFKNCYVHNYCPFCFMNESGKNITPPSLKIAERAPLQEICDRSLVGVIELLCVEYVVGVGKYGAERAMHALRTLRKCEQTDREKSLKGNERTNKEKQKVPKQPSVTTITFHPGDGCQGVAREVKVCNIMHPSPINPAANKGWSQIATSQLTELGIINIIKGIE